jgi:hypothetical protein
VSSTLRRLGLAATLCAAGPAPLLAQLPGQVIVDPSNGSFLARNQDADGDGKPDPFLPIGPGDPEAFLYLGERLPDGTRLSSRQLEIVAALAAHGGNAIYFQAVRSHGGDGAFDHNPWRDPKDPRSGLNPAVLAQWKRWLDALREADVTAFFFLYDDGVHPFDDGGCAANGAVSPDEQRFVAELVRELAGHPNLVWIVQEELRFVGPKEPRKPCDAARRERMRQLARVIRRSDPNRHVVGVHHNVGEPMEFPDDDGIDLYAQQADTTKERATLDSLHASGVSGFDARGRYAYVMAEAYDWHHLVMRQRDRTTLRKTMYASVTAGGGFLVLGMFTDSDPTPEMLGDMRRLQRFMEATDFNRMAPADDLADGATRWVLADRGRSHLLFSDRDGRLALKDLPPGRYRLRWLDAVDGDAVEEEREFAGGPADFERPASLGSEALVWVRRP